MERCSFVCFNLLLLNLCLVFWAIHYLFFSFVFFFSRTHAVSPDCCGQLSYAALLGIVSHVLQTLFWLLLNLNILVLHLVPLRMYCSGQEKGMHMDELCQQLKLPMEKIKYPLSLSPPLPTPHYQLIPFIDLSFCLGQGIY